MLFVLTVPVIPTSVCFQLPPLSNPKPQEPVVVLDLTIRANTLDNNDGDIKRPLEHDR